MATDRTDEQERHDAQEERHYWDSIEDERIAGEMRRAAEKASAIEAMETWFHEQFEDPQIDMPRDSEDEVFLYPFGGPFEAGDVLHDTFRHEFEEAWIVEADERITDSGTFEWAPTSSGEYYEHPEPESEQAPATASRKVALTNEILDRLMHLEAVVAAMLTRPTALGHNQPPEDIGLPPYTDEDAGEIRATIVDTRQALARAVDPVEVNRLSTRFEALRAKVGPWLARKGDLAVDKIIENSIGAYTWAGAFGLIGGIAALLRELAHTLLGG